MNLVLKSGGKRPRAMGWLAADALAPGDLEDPLGDEGGLRLRRRRRAHDRFLAPLAHGAEVL